MQEENREQITGAEEITGWYIPKANLPQEVEGCYVHSQPLPESLREKEPPEKRSRKRLWIFFGIFAALAIVAAVLALVLTGSRRAVTMPDEDNSDASSIVNILNTLTTKIPRADTVEGVRLTISDPGEELTAQDVYAKVSPSTVIVLAQQGERTSVGTGVIMTADGYVITNTHVIAGGDSAGIVLYGEYLLEAELVGYDSDMDIAVLKAQGANDLPPAEFGNSDLCRVGDTVYAIGNPLGIELYGSMSNGILSAINRDVELSGHTVTALQTTAALNNGNSGGPLINTAGQVIGINTLKMGNVTADDAIAQVEGLGFALPISDVSFVVNDIIATGKYHGTPSFGITVIAAKDSGGSDVVVIYETSENGSAYAAGLREGDVILAVDDQEIHTVTELLAIRRAHQVGDTVSVRYWHEGVTKTVDVTLEPNK